MKPCSYPRCSKPGEPVNAFGTPGGFVRLCSAHATAWDLLAQKIDKPPKLQKKIMYRMFKDWIEQPAKVGYGDDGSTPV